MEFSRFTPNTICSESDYRKELLKVREKGYAIDMEEEADGVICIGAPVFDYRGTPKAAIWVTGPKFRLTQERIEKTAQAVKLYSDQLSLRLGYRR